MLIMFLLTNLVAFCLDYWAAEAIVQFYLFFVVRVFLAFFKSSDGTATALLFINITICCN